MATVIVGFLGQLIIAGVVTYIIYRILFYLIDMSDRES